MSTETLKLLAERLARGQLIPCLGPGTLSGVVDRETGEPIPADNRQLILALNNGRPMAPRLMWEFARAAMQVELKRGRATLNRFLIDTYGRRNWSRSPIHDWLAAVRPPYIVDFNRDTQLQQCYAASPHLLVRGLARIGGTPHRFCIHHWDGATYREIEQGDADGALPVLFKPLGSPDPVPTFVASDADLVDYITELMGGFAIPTFVKAYRRGRQYALLGLRLNRDTERMLLSNIIEGARAPAGWALIQEPTAKERRFCDRQGIEIIAADIPDLLRAAEHFHDETPKESSR